MKTNCKSCGKPADSERDYCHGCGLVVCFKCAMRGVHHGNGAHWLMPKEFRYGERRFCDKCDNEITETQQYALTIFKVKSDRTIVEIDLCPACYASIRKLADI